MRIAFVTPPLTKPSEPGLSAAAACRAVRLLGGEATWIDASIGWYRFALNSRRLEATLERVIEAGLEPAKQIALRRAVRAQDKVTHSLQDPDVYGDRRVYTSAIAHLENALRLVGLEYPGLRLGIASVGGTEAGARPESAAWLASVASNAGPFDAYFEQELIPWIEQQGADIAGISLTFQQQAPAAMRLAALLEQRLPGVRRVLGGPLVACWLRTGARLDVAPFELFDEVLAGGPNDLARLAAGEDSWSLPGGEGAWSFPRVEEKVPGRFLRLNAPQLDLVDWPAYWAPKPIVPVALGRGCYWRRCTFCPDHLHPSYRVCSREALTQWLDEVADRFPAGAMLHLTDSALLPSHLECIAEHITRHQLPLQWHGFVRLEADLTETTFTNRLARGGCQMLQLGVESGSERILELLGKGTTVARARAVLRASSAAGIRNEVYVLFGLPTETDEDREQTLALIEDEADHIHALNVALFNLPRHSLMHRQPRRFGITEVLPFGEGTELSLYDDFRCGDAHPRTEARRWLDHNFFKSPAVRCISGNLRSPLKTNHLCFLPTPSSGAA